MPAYPWLDNKKINYMSLRKKLSVMKMLGVPYDENTVANADIIAEQEALEIFNALIEQDPSLKNVKDTEIIALIAYLQSLGKR